jgi:hypothetical protein
MATIEAQLNHATIESTDSADRAAVKIKAFDWSPIIYFYCIYLGVVFLGEVSGFHANIIGAAIFLVLLYGRYWKSLFSIKINALFFCVIFSSLITLIPLISYNEKMLLATINDLAKYYGLNFVILIGLSLPLTPINQSKRSWLLYFFILCFLLTGWVWGIISGVHEARVKGFLANANNFALTAVVLLFLLDFERIRIYARIFSHALVITMIYISGTGGAMVGYLAGMTYKHLFSRKGKFKGLIVIALGIALITSVIFAVPAGEIKPIDSMVRKFTITLDNIDRVIAKKQIDFYSIIQREKQDNTSLLWRLQQWRIVIDNFINLSPEHILFGAGIGSSFIKLKSLPHNDYLRILFETGLIGFFLNMAIWISIYRRMDIRYRWAVLMIAVFSFTENNYDHFFAMSLVALYMLSSAKRNISGILNT